MDHSSFQLIRAIFARDLVVFAGDLIPLILRETRLFHIFIAEHGLFPTDGMFDPEIGGKDDSANGFSRLRMLGQSVILHGLMDFKLLSGRADFVDVNRHENYSGMRSRTLKPLWVS